jgi:hypothetical protein
MTQIPARLGIVVLLAFVLAPALTVSPAAAQQASEGPQRVDDGALEGTGTEAGTTATVASAALNLRFLPSLDATILAVMPSGSEVEIIGEPENGFVPVTYDGTSGYAYGDYLSTGAAPASTAAPAPAGGDVVSIIYAAAAAYGQSGDDMLRVATCESGLNPYAYNPAGWYGLFQFVPGTFAGTPYGAYDIFDPWANANAAAWMWSVGRRGEWTCQ